MSTQVGPKCTLMLYQANARTFEIETCAFSMAPFSRKSAKKANNIVCAFFNVRNKWDKKLLKCVFFDTRFDLFEFQKNNGKTTLGVAIIRKEDFFFSPKAPYQPLEDRKLSVSDKNKFGINKYELNCEQIRKQSDLYSIAAALLNCDSFQRVKEFNSKLSFKRTIEKLNASKL